MDERQDLIKTYDTYGLKLTLGGSGLDEMKAKIRARNADRKLNHSVMKGICHSSSFFPLFHLPTPLSWADWMRLKGMTEVKRIASTLKVARFDTLRMSFDETGVVKYYDPSWIGIIAEIHKACDFEFIPVLSNVPLLTCNSYDAASNCYGLLCEVQKPIIAIVQSSVIINSKTLDQRSL